jgi:hypothetical protein
VHAPVLDGHAVLEPLDVDVVVRHLAVRRRDAHEVTRVTGVVRGMDDHRVTLGDHLPDLPLLVREDAPEPEHRALRTLEPAGLLGAPRVVDAVLGNHRGECLDVACREDLFPRPAGCGLDVDHDA